MIVGMGRRPAKILLVKNLLSYGSRSLGVISMLRKENIFATVLSMLDSECIGSPIQRYENIDSLPGTCPTDQKICGIKVGH